MLGRPTFKKSGLYRNTFTAQRNRAAAEVRQYYAHLGSTYQTAEQPAKAIQADRNALGYDSYHVQA